MHEGIHACYEFTFVGRLLLFAVFSLPGCGGVSHGKAEGRGVGFAMNLADCFSVLSVGAATKNSLIKPV